MVKKQMGLSIIQLMVLLLVAGIAGSLALKAIIDQRCQATPSETLCKKITIQPTRLTDHDYAAISLTKVISEGAPNRLGGPQ